jgi:hypothetical protein
MKRKRVAVVLAVCCFGAGAGTGLAAYNRLKPWHPNSIIWCTAGRDAATNPTDPATIVRCYPNRVRAGDYIASISDRSVRVERFVGQLGLTRVVFKRTYPRIR